MIFLSRLILNLQDGLVRRDLADCQELHRTILSGFPQAFGSEKARERFGVLHRIEVTRNSATLLVQSTIEPNWSKLKNGYLVDTDSPNPSVKRVDHVYARLQAQCDLRFRLHANPTKRLSPRSPRKGKLGPGKRVDLRREDDQIAWLHRKGDQGGFAVQSVQVSANVPNVRAVPGRVTGDRPSGHPRAQPKLMFGSVLLEGVLRVTEPAAFLQTLERGVGSGKAYGFGLLSIAPA